MKNYKLFVHFVIFVIVFTIVNEIAIWVYLLTGNVVVRNSPNESYLLYFITFRLPVYVINGFIDSLLCNKESQASRFFCKKVALLNLDIVFLSFTVFFKADAYYLSILWAIFRYGNIGYLLAYLLEVEEFVDNITTYIIPLSLVVSITATLIHLLTRYITLKLLDKL